MLISRERKEHLKGYLQGWDFEEYPLMPLTREDADYLLSLIARHERDNLRNKEYARRKHESHNGESDISLQSKN